MTKTLKNKVEKPKKKVPITLESTPMPAETKSGLPIVDGVQAVEIIREIETAIEYKLVNGTTTFVAKK